MAASQKSGKTQVDVLIVAVPETAGSALYGMVDVLKAAGSVWETLTRQGNGKTLFNVRIVALRRKLFVCGNGIPVKPDCVIDDDPKARIVILPELWLAQTRTSATAIRLS